jgi:hypothetical protein
LAQIKDKAPAYYTTQNRAVTASDYQYLALTQVPGVLEAIAWGGEEVGRYGEVFVCVAGSNRASVPQSLLDATAALLQEKRTIPMIVNVVPPIPITVDLAVDVFVSHTYDLNTAKNLTVSAIVEFFQNLRIGQSLQYSDLTSVIGTIPPTDYVNFTTLVSVPGVIAAGQLVADLIPYASPSTLEVWRGAVKLWEYADGGHSLFKDRLILSLGVADGAVVVRMKSMYNDVYISQAQSLTAGIVDVFPHKSNRPGV